jgi:hypothetical protein
LPPLDSCPAWVGMQTALYVREGEMSVHDRRTVFGLCLAAAALLVTAPTWAAPADYDVEVVEVGPQHSHVTTHLTKKADGSPVNNALVAVDADVGPANTLAPTMTEHFIARPGPKPGDWTVIPEPGMRVFLLHFGAEVEGETEMITGDFDLSQVGD